jgi:IPT/TIG domain/Putative Flp pilus-assembly TadE/G-like
VNVPAAFQLRRGTVTRRRKAKDPGISARLAEMRLLAYQRRQRGQGRREGGQVLIIFALTIVVLMLFASIVLDLGLLRNNRQLLVNAIDAGALAGGTLLPIDGCNNDQQTSACTSYGTGAAAQRVQDLHDLIRDTVQSTYPGITEGPNGWQMSYRCLVGVDTNNPTQPYLTRDVPLVCNPRRAGPLSQPGVPAGDAAPVASEFGGAGLTRYSWCYPELGDKCNVVVITGITTTQYSFGRVVGINQGSTGAVLSAACNGPCGQPPAIPVDLMIIIDRTTSMQNSNSVSNLRSGASAVLTTLNPALQWAGLAMLGPSGTTNCSGSPGGVKAIAGSVAGVSRPSYQASSSGTNWNASGGANSVVLQRPSGTSAGHFLLAGIAVSNGTNTPPTVTGVPSGWQQVRMTVSTAGSSTSNVRMYTYRKWATGSEPATYTFDLSSSNARAVGGIMRFTGVDTSDPIQFSTGNTASSASTNVVASGTTPTYGGITIASFHVTNTGTTFGSYSPGSISERFDFRNTNSAGPSIAGATDSYSEGSGYPLNSTGNNTATAGASSRWAGQLIAINGVATYPADLSTDLSKWVVVGLTGPGAPVNQNYQNADGTLNTNSNIVKAVNCFDVSSTGTNLSTSLDMAVQYLLANGRPGVKRGIILETDGAPSSPVRGAEDKYTCAAALASADAVKALDPPVELYTIGYGVASSSCPDSSDDGVQLLAKMATDSFGTPACSAAENSDGDHFFCQPTGGDLAAVFRAVTTQFAGNRSHLVQLDPLPIIYSVSPSSGSGASAHAITISGKYFTGATTVTIGGQSQSFTFVSDTTITTTVPAGAPGTLDVIVTTVGGSSPANHPADRFTRN